MSSISGAQLEGEKPARLSLREIFVSKGCIVSLDHSHPGHRVICRSGLIWLTQEDDVEDYLMGEGTSFAISRPGRIVFEALQDSVVSIVSCGTRGDIVQAGRA